MQLINTIELSPYSFASREYDYPTGSSMDLPEAWDQFWKKCISDKNLERLEAIRKGSYLVDIRTINDEELETILINELKEVELSDFEEQVNRMYGGIVLEVNENIYIEPTCCGDIGNIKEWESIFETELNNWTNLWIGHPWIFYRKVDGIIEFSDYTESNLADLKDIEILISVSESELETELKQIRQQQNDFEYRIRKVLDKMGIAGSERISKLLTGNN
jgi:hypothetical protein